MDAKTLASEITPFIRIGLWAGGGLAINGGIPETYVNAAVLDPEIIGAVAWAVAAIWYGMAKWAGWRT